MNILRRILLKNQFRFILSPIKLKFTFSTSNEQDGLKYRYATFDDEAKKVFMDFFKRSLKPKEQKLTLIYETFQTLRGCKFGIIDNQDMMKSFLMKSHSLILNSLPDINLHNMTKEELSDSLTTLLKIYQAVFEFQLVRWEGVLTLQQWIQKPTSLNLFINLNAPYMLLRFINLLHKNDISIHPLVPNVHNLIAYFTENPVKDLKMRFEYFYAITIIREMSPQEKDYLKKTIEDLSKQDQLILMEEKDFLHISAGYVYLTCQVFFPSVVDESLPFVSASESEMEQNPDENILESLQRLVILYQQQDMILYNHYLYQYEYSQVKEDNIGFVDPIKWQSLGNVSEGIQVLGHYNMTDSTVFGLFQDSVGRKLETDMIDFKNGIRICNNLMRFDNYQVGVVFRIIELICLQIQNQKFDELNLTANMIARLLQTILKLKKTSSGYEEQLMSQTISKIETLIVDGHYNEELRKVDLFDLKVISDQNKLNRLLDYCNVRLSE